MQLWIDPANDESQPLLLLCSQQGGVLAITPLEIPSCFAMAKYLCPSGSWPGRNGLTPPVKSKRGALPSRNKSRPVKKRSGSCHSLTRAAPGAGWRPPLSTTIALAEGAAAAMIRCQGASSQRHRVWLTSPKKQTQRSTTAVITGQRQRPINPTSSKINEKPRGNKARVRSLLSRYNNSGITPKTASHSLHMKQTVSRQLIRQGLIYGAWDKLLSTGEGPSG
jgi:hypothetical protein